MIEKTFTVGAEEGLHARPASVLAKECMKFNCDLKLYQGDNRDKAFQPKSILSIMTIGAQKGDVVTILADGSDEDAAISKLTELFESDFE